MPQLELKVSHRLSVAEAIQCAGRWLDQLGDQHKDVVRDVKDTWTKSKADISCRIRGFKVTGALTVDAETVRVNAKLPLLAAVFKSQILEVEEALVKSLREALDKQKGARKTGS